MKVLIVVEPGVDGVFRHVEGLCQYLFSQQVEVHLAYSSLRGSDGLKTLVEAVRNRGGQTLDMRTGNAPCLADMRAFIKLRGLARKVRPDVIHAHSSKAGVLGRTLALAGIKAGFFYTAHAYYGLSGARSRKISFFNWIERIFGKIGNEMIPDVVAILFAAGVELRLEIRRGAHGFEHADVVGQKGVEREREAAGGDFEFCARHFKVRDHAERVDPSVGSAGAVDAFHAGE